LTVIDAPALAIRLKGEVLPPINGDQRLTYQGGILTLAPHHGDQSLTLYFEGYRGDPLGVTSRAVWGGDIDVAAHVASALVNRYEREKSREVALTIRARMKERNRT